MKRSSIIFSILFSIIILVLICYNLGNLRIGYIELFKISTILANHNRNGQIDGQLIKYVDGKVEIKSNFIKGLKDG